jgi:hypothetical protein
VWRKGGETRREMRDRRERSYEVCIVVLFERASAVETRDERDKKDCKTTREDKGRRIQRREED